MASKKKPSWQFYPGDWMKDPGLRSVSSGARGIWIDMLCLMFECDRRGFLLVNGKPASLEMIARMTGNSSADASRYLTELEASGVFSRTSHGMDGEGCIYSRRMVRDEANKKAWRENGKKGGNPKIKNPPDLVEDLVNPIPNQNSQGGVNQNCRSSSSTSAIKRETDASDPPEIPDSLITVAEGVLGPTPIGQLRLLSLDGHPMDWIEKAVKETGFRGISQGTQAVNYTRKILQEWHKHGGPPSDDDCKGVGNSAKDRSGDRRAAAKGKYAHIDAVNFGH